MDIDIVSILNELKFGICSIDFGRFDLDNNQWCALYRYSTPLGNGLHEAITAQYLKNIDNFEPIHYLFLHYEENPPRESGVLVHTFPVSDDVLKLSDKSNKLIATKCDVMLQEGTVKSERLETISSVEEFMLKIPSSIKTDLSDGNISSLKKFEISQDFFTNYVANVFNGIHNAPVVKYVSIILCSFKSLDGKCVFTHNAAVFSDNVDFLEKDTFKLLLTYVTSSNYLDEIDKLRIKSIESSLKSAKAAIMSRNMSHNLGSHVMFYIKQKLQSVSKIVDSKVLDNIIPGKIPDIAAVEAAIKANKGIELPFLVGLGRFINYLQERQDYIATIATDYIPANSTISFKDFIYDELKPELRYQRHHSKSDDAGWKSGNLLLDYIAYSEGYRSCDKIEILFGEFNGSSPVKDTNPDKDFQKLREFNIAVPGGVIGRQALFSIFENIIRNAAKHSERRSDNKLVLQLSLLEKDSVLFTEDEFRAKRNDDKVDYDKCGLDLKKLYANYFDRYHFLRIKVDMPNPDGVIDTLVDNLADPYIDDNGAMKETTKGLKEMRISAAWLRGKSIDTEIPADEPPAISIYSEPYKGDESKVTISYILCIPKPCRVAFVLNIADFETLNIAEFNQSKNLNKLANLNKLFSPYGCKVFNQEQLSDDKVIEEIANYEIVCMSENDKDICSRISSRYIIDDVTNENQLKKNDLLTNLINSIENTDYTNEKNKKDAIEDSIGSVYDTWFKITYNDVTPKLVVADGKAVQNNKRENGHLSSDSNVILTTTGKVGDEDNASTQNSENANDASVTLSERIVTKDDVKGAVVYSTHFKGLSSKSEGPDGYNTWLQDAICIESVTGNNSTARLIRQDEWTKEWKTKILSAGMARVAIFDERIFSSFISRESVLKYDNVSIEDIKTLITEYKSKEQTEEVLLEFCQKMDDEYGINDNDSSDIYYDFKTIDDVINCLEITYHYDIAQKNHERRIWAFDIIVPKEVDGIVEIVGYNVHIGDCVGAYSEHKTDAIITIAKISRYCELGQYDIKLCDDKKVFATGNSNIFDYISIHQGVLDKIYTAFGIKNDEDEKYKVTNALHKCFSKQDTPMDAKEFLPNFIIHSGRSKPSKNDMPQKQPFVQFAAVDHAVKDCKYTLVELLATAHYEKSDNNN